MQIYNFQGELTDVLANKEALASAAVIVAALICFDGIIVQSSGIVNTI